MRKEVINRFREKREAVIAGGGDAKVKAQHNKGKLIARERIGYLLDDSSFIENQAYIQSRTNSFGMDKKKIPGDGVITGSGKIDGRQVFVSSQDFTVLGGSLGEMHAEKIAAAQRQALKNGTPFIQINDSGGARIQEGILSLDGFAKIFRHNALSSGVIPQFSVILGPCAGGSVYSPAMTDFIFMVDQISHMYITGPDVIKTVTGEIITHEELGGSSAHCSKSGVAHFRFPTERACLSFIRNLLTYLPSNNRELPPVVEPLDIPDRKTPAIDALIPESEKRAYDMRAVIHEVFDKGSFLEVHKDWACSMVVGFARLNGRTVGVYANQPSHMAAVMDIDSSVKGSRFIRFCDSFNIPLISFVDVPGYLPGIDQEHNGIIRHGAKMLYAIAEATVPKISLIIRKAYGGAMIAMAAKSLGYDRVLAFPSAEIAVMGSEGAANIIFSNEISSAADPDKKKQEKIQEFQDEFMNPFVAAELGLIDDIIDPEFTRIELIRSLESLYRKHEDTPARKHGNIPL